MTTTSSKNVPRSRLNITYRTRIDGQVVQKKLPLRLLVAGDFSGRAFDRAGAPTRDAKRSGCQLPMLDQRLIYAIGKEGTIETVLKQKRIGLPVPKKLTHARTFAARGMADVRIERREGELLIQLQHCAVAALELVPGNGSAGVHAADSKSYDGELESFSKAVFSRSARDLKKGLEQADTANKAAAAAQEKALAELEASQVALSKADETGRVAAAKLVKGKQLAWTRAKTEATRSAREAREAALDASGQEWSASVADLGGWLEPVRQQPGEPPMMFEVDQTETPEIMINFTEQQVLDLQAGADVEMRVRIHLKKVLAAQVIPLLDMAAFEPERVAEAVPEIRRLLVLRWLVSQARSMLGSNPVLRNKFKEQFLTSDPTGVGSDNLEDIDLAEEPRQPVPDLQKLKDLIAPINQDGGYLLAVPASPPAPAPAPAPPAPPPAE